MSRARAAGSHRTPEHHPIRVRPGEVVEVGRHDSTWPAFVFITSESGEGWVPSRCLAITEGQGVVTQGYDTKELATVSSEELEILQRDYRSGWHWCRNRAGAEGWVPIDALEEPGWD